MIFVRGALGLACVIRLPVIISCRAKVITQFYLIGFERTTLADAGKGSQTYIFRVPPEYDMQMPAAFILPLVILHAAELT